MNLNEFLKELEANTDPNVIWKQFPSSNGKNNYIIGIDINSDRKFDPITFLLWQKQKRYYVFWDTELAAKRLGMNRDTAWSIIMTSDFIQEDYRKILNTTALFDLELRLKIEGILIK